MSGCCKRRNGRASLSFNAFARERVTVIRAEAHPERLLKGVRNSARPCNTRNMSTTAAAAEPLVEHVIIRGKASGFLQEGVAGKYTFRVDEPRAVGGTELGPDPYDYILAALGSCTSMTIGWYARRNKIPLEDITVRLSHSRIYAKDCEKCETKNGMLDRIDVKVEMTGPITPHQNARLMEVAAKCPVHRTLKSEIDICLRQDKSGVTNETKHLAG